MASRRCNTARRKLTPPDVAAIYGVSPDKVLAWIRSGELRAINAATSQSGRPRYLVDLDDLNSFEERRTVQPPPNGRRRTRPKGDVIEFF
jgi:hypothetical protein